MKIKLTKRSIDAAKTGARDPFLWDAEAVGSGCKVTPKGPRVFIFQYWANGRARRVTLGRYGSELTVEQARIMSRHLRCKKNHRHRSGYVDNSLPRILAHTHCATTTALSSRNPMLDPQATSCVDAPPV